MQDFSGWWLNQTNQKESLGTTVGVFLMLTQKKIYYKAVIWGQSKTKYFVPFGNALKLFAKLFFWQFN